MSRTAAFAAAPRPSVATLDDYTNFHGMLCRPRTAQRCIDSFTGTVLFIPEHCETSAISRYDCSKMLTLWSYYALVLVSLTGLSTLFKQTKFLVAQQVPPEQEQANADQLVSQHCHPPLSVTQNVLDYVLQQTDSSSLQLTRRFEYHFGGLVPVSVIMLHLSCDKGLLHLVEVYRVERGRRLFSFLTDTLGEAVRWMVSRGKKKH
jgi:hypothetical protein